MSSESESTTVLEVGDVLMVDGDECRVIQLQNGGYNLANKDGFFLLPESFHCPPILLTLGCVRYIVEKQLPAAAPGSYEYKIFIKNQSFHNI